MNKQAQRFFLLAILLLLAGCQRETPPAPLDIRTVLGSAATEGYQQALVARPFNFPEDHGPHFGFRDEWWYVTGNLRADDDRRYGFQITFFRRQIQPGTGIDSSDWQSPQVYMAHFAVTDIDGDNYTFFERFGRPAAGIAGARAQPFAVWLDSWRLEALDTEARHLRLSARAGAIALELELQADTAPVPQGDNGLSRKSAAPGNASFYYSMPRLTAHGNLRDRNGQDRKVHGLAWLDREWSTSALGAEQVGWDWFSLQLDDGRSLMLYRLRHRDGGTDAFSYAALLGADGSKHTLPIAELELTPLDYWTSPTRTRYPIRWRLRSATHDIDWEIAAALPQQWFNGNFRYWEGAVIIRTNASAEIGRGYMELTGY